MPETFDKTLLWYYIIFRKISQYTAGNTMYYNSISPSYFNSFEKKTSGKKRKKLSSQRDFSGEYFYKLLFSFNGTNYFGWQRQSCGNTIQETLEEILRNIFHKEDLVLTACGRTDTGVHALGMTASFHVDAKIPPEELKTCLNKRVPHDIIIHQIELLPYFNAHEEAKGKAYVYTVKLGNYAIFLPDFCWCWLEKGDLDAVKQALQAVAGTHDFSNFSGRSAPNSVRTVFRAEFYDFSPVICFYFSGNGFLHKMVRRLVGGLHQVYTGRIRAEDFICALHEKDFHSVTEVAPPKGLFLKKVFYKEEEWKEDILQYPPFFY